MYRGKCVYTQSLFMQASLFWDVTQRRLVVSEVFRVYSLTLEDGTDRLCRNVGNYVRCVTSQRSELLYFATEDCHRPGPFTCCEFTLSPYWNLLHLNDLTNDPEC